MKFLDINEIGPTVRKLIRASDNVALPVAFWGQGAATNLFHDVRPEDKQSIRVLCDLDMGGTNPREIDQLLFKKYRVAHYPHLHAKVYLGDHAVVVGSANASTNGLGLGGTPRQDLQEAALYSEDANVVARAWDWFERLWEKSRLVKDDPEALERARDRWTRERARIPIPSLDASLLEVVRDRPEEIDGRVWFAVYPTDTEGSDAAQRGIDALQEKDPAWGLLDYYWGWPEVENLPPKARIIDLTYGPNGRFEYRKTQYEVVDLPPGDAEEGTSYRVVKAVKNPELVLSKGDRKLLSHKPFSEMVWSAAYPHSRFPYDPDVETGGVLSVQQMRELLLRFAPR